jgi:hypothetical protein
MNNLEIAKRLTVALRALSKIPEPVGAADQGVEDSASSAKQYIRQARRYIDQKTQDEATRLVDGEAKLADDVIQAGAALIEELGELVDELRCDRDPEIGDEMETYLAALQAYDEARKVK